MSRHRYPGWKSGLREGCRSTSTGPAPSQTGEDGGEGGEDGGEDGGDGGEDGGDGGEDGNHNHGHKIDSLISNLDDDDGHQVQWVQCRVPG